MRDAPEILTGELAGRVEQLLIDWRHSGLAPAGAAQDFARMARELGVGIVDIGRNRAWVDEKVHESVLIRCREAEQALAEFQGLLGGQEQ